MKTLRKPQQKFARIRFFNNTVRRSNEQRTYSFCNWTSKVLVTFLCVWKMGYELQADDLAKADKVYKQLAKRSLRRSQAKRAAKRAIAFMCLKAVIAVFFIVFCCVKFCEPSNDRSERIVTQHPPSVSDLRVESLIRERVRANNPVNVEIARQDRAAELQRVREISQKKNFVTDDGLAKLDGPISLYFPRTAIKVLAESLRRQFE